MIPRTFPSILEDGKTKCVVYVLPSISGLQAWKDYIPVKGVTTENTAVENTYANNGYIVMKTVDGTQKAWIDYLPVYEDASYNKAWSTDAGGYIPASGLFSVRGTLFANSEPGVWYDPSDMTTLFQDSAGTTPVTAVEQPVGLMLDKSGNNLHATQSTSTSRPVLSARYNLLTKTEQFSDAIWTKTRLSITANSTTAPDGTLTADTLVENTDNNSHTLSTSISLTAGASHVVSAYVKDAGREWIVVSLPSAAFGGTTTRAFFNINTGTLGTQQNGTATVTSVGDGWYRCTFTATPTVTTTGSLTVSLSSANGSSSYQGNGTSGIYLWGAQFIVANSLTSNAYQRVDTSTVYDSDATKFPPYLKFDGVDDWMVTPTITPGTNKGQMFIGLRNLVDNAGVIAETSTAAGSNTGAIVLRGTTPSAFQLTSRGTATALVATASTFASPVTLVLSAQADISAPSATIRGNGTATTVTTAQGTGNYLAYPLYIGRRAGTTFPFNGQLYSLITRFGSNLSTATIEAAESYVAQKTGITI